MFFFLVQTEQGDIFKVTMEVDEDMVSMRVVEFRAVLYVSDCSVENVECVYLRCVNRYMYTYFTPGACKVDLTLHVCPWLI